jgi:hypothetical protein
MCKRWFQSAFFLCLFASATHAQSRDALLKAVGENAVWSAKGAPSVYDAANMEAFDRNLAPLLKRYGVKGVTVQNWQSSAGRVRTTLFEMLDAGAAYGLFTVRRAAEAGTSTAPASPVGAESFHSRNGLYFWQAGYVVRVEGPSEASARMGQALSERILGRSRKPPVSNHLPARNLVAGTDQYVLTPDRVDRAFGVDPSILGFDDDVEIATASYRVNNTAGRLMLLLYPTQQVAKKYQEQLEAAKPGLASVSKRVGPLVAIVAGAENSAAVQSILDDVNYETKVTWNQPRPGIGIAEVILTVFTFIGISLGFTVFAGVGFGGVRIFVKSRYPNRLFDRPEDLEIIQLKLAQGVMRKELGQ